MSQTESVGSPVTQELVPQGAAGAEPPDAALVNDPSFKCGFHLFDSAGKPWHRPSCTFPCCIVPLSAGSDDSRKWQRTLAAEDSDSVSTNLSPPPGPDTRKRLLMDTPPEGWDAYQAAYEADKKVSKSENKKPAQGAGSSRLITEEEPLSPVGRQPEFDDE